MRRAGGRWAAGGLLVLAVLLAGPVVVRAEEPDFYVGFYLGLSQPLKSDFTVRDDAAAIERLVQDVGFGGTFLLGFKAGGYFPRKAGSPWPQFGLEIEYYGFDADRDVEKLRPAGDVFGAHHFAANTLALNVLARYPLLRSLELPNGRFQVYAGVGSGIEWARVEERIFFLGFLATTVEDRDSGPVFQGLAGMKVFLTPHLALFTEYKYSHASHSLHFRDITEKFDLRVNHFYGGLAYHF